MNKNYIPYEIIYNKQQTKSCKGSQHALSTLGKFYGVFSDEIYMTILGATSKDHRCSPTHTWTQVNMLNTDVAMP